MIYLDSSALIKLIVYEDETSGLVDFLATDRCARRAAIASVEVIRTAQLIDDNIVASHARRLMAGVHLIRPDDLVLASATRLEPRSLRALDAIHLATALSLGSELAGMVVYDRRLAAAARQPGLTVWAPA